MIENPLIAEFVGTAVLLLLGAGVVANVNLKKTIGENQTPWVLITSAWGFAVFVAVFVAALAALPVPPNAVGNLEAVLAIPPKVAKIFFNTFKAPPNLPNILIA